MQVSRVSGLTCKTVSDPRFFRRFFRNGNPYVGINAVLENLGFTSANGLHHGQERDHQNHFHIDLRAPGRLEIPHNLLTDGNTSNQADPLVANAQSLLDQAKADLNLTQGEVSMFISDMPNVPPQNMPMMIAQANQAQQGDVNAVRAMGVCHPVPNMPDAPPTGDNSLSPIIAARNYFYLYEHQKVTGPATVTVLQSSKHGELADDGEGGYVYLPEKGHLGDDKAIFLVNFSGGLKVKVVYFFQAFEGFLGNTGLEDMCSETGVYWKISTTLDPNGNGTITSIEHQSPVTSAADQIASDTAALAATLGINYTTGITADSAATAFSSTPGASITLNFASLPNCAIGQTVGANITLDTSAAGNGWFIDTTPGTNEEYLPTSNPNEWVAKAGSAAAGKMDMLSVLLHEYGHALGIEHSADAHDYMGTTLTPGVRRLPSAVEMALMQQLIAQAKEKMTATLSPSPSPASGRG